RAEVAPGGLPGADGGALPAQAAGQPAPAGLRAALAGGERHLAAQAAAGLGAVRQVGGVARARMLPPGTHPQPHDPRRYGVEGFNRASALHRPTKVLPRLMRRGDPSTRDRRAVLGIRTGSCNPSLPRQLDGQTRGLQLLTLLVAYNAAPCEKCFYKACASDGMGLCRN